MKILSKERFVFAGIIIALVGIIAYGAIWFNVNYVVMPVPREMVKNVEVCIDNDVACSLIYESKEEIDK